MLKEKFFQTLETWSYYLSDNYFKEEPNDITIREEQFMNRISAENDRRKLEWDRKLNKFAKKNVWISRDRNWKVAELK